MAILLKTASVRVSSIQIIQVKVQNKGKSVWKSRYDGDVTGHTITLWCSGWRELRNYSALFQMKTKLVTSNILLHDQIVETLFSCYDDFPLHSEIL